jgi:hypothetical protein
MRVFLFGFLFFISNIVLANCQNDDLYCHILSNIDFQSQFIGVSLLFVGLIFSAVIIRSLFLVLEFVSISRYELLKKFNEYKLDNKNFSEEIKEADQIEEQDFEQKEENKLEDKESKLS